MPRRYVPPTTRGQRVAAGLGKSVLFLLLLAVLGLGFWALSGDNAQTLRDLVPRAAPPPPEDEPPPPPPPAVPMGPATIVLSGPGGDVRISDGTSGWVDLGHRGHRLRVTATVAETRITLRTAGGHRYHPAAGGALTLRCEQKRVERVSQGGVVSIKQVPCPDTATLRVALIAPSGGPPPGS